MKGIDLAVIINSYNRIALLKGCVASLCNSLRDSGIKYAIIIFDAHSTDGSPEWVENFINENGLQNVDLILPGLNESGSFSAGVNAACAYAMNKYPDLRYFFLYETDNLISSAEPLQNAQKLMDENKEIAACGFTVKKHNGHPAGFASAFPGISSFLLGQQFSFYLHLGRPVLRWLKTASREFSYADVVYTSPLLIKKEVWNKLNGFDAVQFPFSDCDIDLAFRIKKEGLKMAVLKTSSLIHDNLEEPSEWSAKRTTNFYRARLSYFKKHYGQWINLLKPMLFIMHFLELLLLFILMIAGRRKSNAVLSRWALMKSVFVNYKLIN